jgi:phospholipid transport system substrate-binding protein
VRQLIYSGQPEPYVLLYQMGRGKDGQWQLRNVIIESVNLGEIYRSQFEASARKYDGDLDAVIDTWETVEVDTDSKEEA